MQVAFLIGFGLLIAAIGLEVGGVDSPLAPGLTFSAMIVFATLWLPRKGELARSQRYTARMRDELYSARAKRQSQPSTFAVPSACIIWSCALIAEGFDSTAPTRARFELAQANLVPDAETLEMLCQELQPLSEGQLKQACESIRRAASQSARRDFLRVCARVMFKRHAASHSRCEEYLIEIGDSLLLPRGVIREIAQSVAPPARGRESAGSTQRKADFSARAQPLEVLGLPSGATPKQIKRAYHAMAMRYHPDRVGQASSSEQAEAEERFNRIRDAYQRLMAHGA